MHRTAQMFRCLGQATHNPVLGLAQEPLLQLLEPSLRVMIDKVPQARSRILTAQRHLVEALQAQDESARRDLDGAAYPRFQKGLRAGRHRPHTAPDGSVTGVAEMVGWRRRGPSLGVCCGRAKRSDC